MHLSFPNIVVSLEENERSKEKREDGRERTVKIANLHYIGGGNLRSKNKIEDEEVREEEEET